MQTSSDAIPAGPSAASNGVLANFDRYLGKTVEFVAGTLVFLEILVLFAGEAPRVCRRLIRSNYAAIGMKSIVA